MNLPCSHKLLRSGRLGLSLYRASIGTGHKGDHTNKQSHPHAMPPRLWTRHRTPSCMGFILQRCHTHRDFGRQFDDGLIGGLVQRAVLQHNQATREP